MTSGNFHNAAIGTIQINREGRQRRELTGISELADSIQRIGLINPIVITRDFTLVAGERRTAACRSLGWTHIPAQFTDELPDHELKAIELEENVKRVDLPWQDRCYAVREYHALRKSDNPKWTMGDTGDAFGYDEKTISTFLTVAHELAIGNTKVIEAPRYTVARGIVERKNERLDAEALSILHTTAKAAPGEPVLKQFPKSILTEDFNKWAGGYDGPKFNFIHCDFPYGIGANKFNQGSATLHGGYEDSEETYWKLLYSLASNIDRLCTDSCHIVFWFSLTHYQSTLDFFTRNTDFSLDPFPLIWLKSDNIGIIPDPQRGPRRVYETALFGARGDRKIVRAKSNAYSCPTVRDSHMSIKPEPMLHNFFEMFVDQSTSFLDPTCGSGSSVRAAEALGAGHVLGIEQNPEFAEGASRALHNARLLRRK